MRVVPLLHGVEPRNGVNVVEDLLLPHLLGLVVCSFAELLLFILPLLQLLGGRVAHCIDTLL